MQTLGNGNNYAYKFRIALKSVFCHYSEYQIIQCFQAKISILSQKCLLQIYGTASITSEEDEIVKKEREIIEILEKEEQWRYRNNTTSEEKDIGE